MEVEAPRLIGIPETDRWVLSLSLKMVENRFFLQTVREVKRSLHGSENIRYVFELYGDDQRQTLLAKVIVSGSAESISPQQHGVMASCRPLGANHWISSGFVLCSLSQFDWTGANDISNRAYDVASSAPRWTKPFARDRRLHLRRRCPLS